MKRHTGLVNYISDTLWASKKPGERMTDSGVTRLRPAQQVQQGILQQHEFRLARFGGQQTFT
jgi:hypothetical protein